MIFLSAKKNFYLTILLPLMALACQQRQEAPMAKSAGDSAVSGTTPASSGQLEGEAQRSRDTLNPFGTTVTMADLPDSLRMFVRTAEVRFRVRQVLSTIQQIEDLTLRNGGFVTVSNLLTEVEYRDEHPISRDSALETTRFSVHGRLVLLVPCRLLDTTLRAMHPLAEFLDYRRVSAEDVALKMMEDQLLQRRQNNYQQRVNAAAQAGKPTIRLEAADRTLSSRAASDRSRIERLKLEDAVQYSTVEVDIYQPAQLRQRMVANTEIRPYERGFWASISDGLRSGAVLLKSIIIRLVQGWSVLLLLALAIWGITKYRRGR